MMHKIELLKRESGITMETLLPRISIMLALQIPYKAILPSVMDMNNCSKRRTFSVPYRVSRIRSLATLGQCFKGNHTTGLTFWAGWFLPTPGSGGGGGPAREGDLDDAPARVAGRGAEDRVPVKAEDDGLADDLDPGVPDAARRAALDGARRVPADAAHGQPSCPL